jgi:HEAT repeat protein
MDRPPFLIRFALTLLSLAPILPRLAAEDSKVKQAEREKKYLSRINVNAEAAKQYLESTGVKPDEKSLLEFLRGFPTEEANRRDLARLVVQLGDDDFETRESAAKRLIAAGLRRMPAELENAARNTNDPEVTARAKKCYDAIFTRDAQIMMTRDWLIERKAVTTLRALLKADSIDVRTQAAVGLRELGPDAEVAIPDLVATLDASDDSLSHAAHEALWCIGPRATETIIGLLDEKRPGMRVLGVEAIGWQVRLAYLPDNGKEILPRLIKIMKDDEPEVRRAALSAIGAIAQEENELALSALIEALKFEDAGKLKGNEMPVAASAAFFLKDVGTNAKRAIPALVEATRAKDSDLAGQAARALGRICGHDPDDTVVSAIMAVLMDKDRGDVRVWAADALTRFGPKAKKTIPDLLAELQKAEGLPPLTCLYVLFEIAPTDERVISALIAQLEDGKPIDDRRYAAELLGRIGPPAKEAVPALRRAIPKDTDSANNAWLKLTIDQAIGKITK